MRQDLKTLLACLQRLRGGGNQLQTWRPMDVGRMVQFCPSPFSLLTLSLDASGGQHQSLQKFRVQLHLRLLKVTAPLNQKARHHAAAVHTCKVAWASEAQCSTNEFCNHSLFWRPYQKPALIS